jgi:hypothetical protein
MGSSSINFDGTDGTGDLGNITGQFSDPRPNRSLVNSSYEIGAHGRQGFALAIIGNGGRSKPNGSFINFVFFGQKTK